MLLIFFLIRARKDTKVRAVEVERPICERERVFQKNQWDWTEVCRRVGGATTARGYPASFYWLLRGHCENLAFPLLRSIEIDGMDE